MESRGHILLSSLGNNPEVVVVGMKSSVETPVIEMVHREMWTKSHFRVSLGRNSQTVVPQVQLSVQVPTSTIT